MAMETKERTFDRRKQLEDKGFTDFLVFENPDYDSAIVGITDDNRVVYDYERMAQSLMDEDGMTYEEAIEFIDYNTMRALPYWYSRSPIVVTEPIDGCDYGSDGDDDPYYKVIGNLLFLHDETEEKHPIETWAYKFDDYNPEWQ